MRVKNWTKVAAFLGLFAAAVPLAEAEVPLESLHADGLIFDAVRVAGLFNRNRFHESFTLLAKPVADGQLTSRYGMRLHPVLGTWVLHAGVDWAAPRGTTIMAAGDGVVVSAGWESGLRLHHPHPACAEGYETTYAHQTRIAAGIDAGATVEQGQVIGQVGSTGMATGPHLHYEVRINGVTVDPLGVELQQAQLREGRADELVREIRAEIDRVLGG